MLNNQNDVWSKDLLEHKIIYLFIFFGGGETKQTTATKNKTTQTIIFIIVRL